MGLTKPRAYQIYDIDYKQAVRVVTTTNITLAGGAPNSVDGVTLSLNDRVLVTGQSTGSQNGIYYVTTLGTGANGTWARSVDGNETGEILAGMIIMVTEGTTYADTQWKLTTNDPIVIGTTSLTFVLAVQANLISSGSSNVVVNANANVTISSAGTANVFTVSSTGTVTLGTASVTGTITTAAGTNSTGFAVGNGAVSNVGLGFFPTAGTRGDYAIRDYSSVFSTMYLDVGIGGSAGGEFQFRSSNAYSLVMRANTTGVYSPGIVSATGIVYGSELNSTNSQVNEGGQINLALPSSGSTLSTSVIIDVYQNKVRFFEGGGTARGAYIDLTSCSAGAATNLLAGGGGGGTPGGSNTYVQFNDAGAFGGNGQFTYDKVTNTLTAGIIAGNSNGLGTNFKVGDDVWIGDVNTADTMSIRGQQNAANGWIVFGNVDTTSKLGRAGSGPLSYTGAFSATANITGGNLLTGGLISATSTVTGTSFIGAVASSTTVSATGNITGGNILTGGLISAASTITGTSHLGSVVSVTANVAGGNITTGGNVVATGNVSGGNVAATTNIYSFSTMQAVGNITGGNILTGGLISAASTITGTSHLGSVVSVSGTITGSSHLGSVVSVSGTITGASLAGTITTASQTNITAVGTLTSLNSGAISSSGNVTAAGHVGTIYTNSIINTGANATGNIGSSTLYFNTAFVKATSAQYADLAEMYVADNPYQPGTVLEFGGDQEVTITTRSHSTAVAGIVSTNPSYLMNSCLEGEHVVAVALTGRVPCQVLGPVKKGDVLVSSNLPGVAQRIGTDWQPGVVVGKSMGAIDLPEVQTIEVAVGRL